MGNLFSPAYVGVWLVAGILMFLAALYLNRRDLWPKRKSNKE